LYTYSQAFANAAWLTIDTTKVSTSATDPNGGTTAANVTWTAGTGRYFYQNVGTSNIATVSFYVKSNGGGNNFRFFANGATSFSANLTATSTWTRYSFSFTGTGAVGVGITNASDNSAANLLFAFAQLETGDIATDYIPTTTAAVSVGPVANVPRLDYLGSTCPRLNLEPQRVNLQLNSESFDNATWTKTYSVVTANQIASPDGYVNADKLDETTANNIHQLESSRTVTVAAYTMSVFAKKGERNFVRLYEDTTSNSAYFNLNTGAVGTVSGATATAKIEDYGNGWYRCSLTYTETGTFGRYRIVVAKQDNETSYAGTAGYGIYIYGAQYELGAYATSYIPTLAASATRGADACSKTGISSLIGQTEGTLFAEIYPEEFVNGSYIGISDGTFTNRIIFGFEGGAGNLLVFGNTGLSGSGTYTRGQKIKIALAYKSGSSALYVNGTLAAGSGNAFTASYSQFNFNSGAGSQNFFGKCAQTLLFKTRLTNAELATLTTL
jgi:hypothetical protein